MCIRDRLKQYGLSDAQIADLTGSDELTVRTCRKMLHVVPAFKTVDTCAAEFPSQTAYHYKTYDACETEVAPKTRRRAMILGAGPNRIGQGIEFDYCCVHASYAVSYTHLRVEAYLAVRFSRSRARRAAEDGAVFQHEQGRSTRGLRRSLHEPLADLAQSISFRPGNAPTKNASI